MLVPALEGSGRAGRVLRWRRSDAAGLPPGLEEEMADGRAQLVLGVGGGGSVLVQVGVPQPQPVASREGLAAQPIHSRAPHSQLSRWAWSDWEGQVEGALADQTAGLLSGGQGLLGLPSCRRRLTK